MFANYLVAILIAVLVLWAIMAAWRFHSAIGAVMGPYRRGDYAGALEAAEGLRRRGEVSRVYCFYRAGMLAQLGRVEDAEEWHRRHIEMLSPQRQWRFLAIGLTALGDLMLQAGRFDEARDCFDSSMKLLPGRGSGYRGMAELCLLRRDSPGEALRWAQLAVEREQVNPDNSLSTRRINLGECLATLAWATAAESHSASDVASLVAEAITSVGVDNVQSTAMVNYQSGRAWADLGDLKASARHYEEAARIDLQGHWGRAARAALKGFS